MLVGIGFIFLFILAVCLLHQVSHSSIPTERKTAGLQLLLDLPEMFLHFIYDNPFNYATSDRVSVLLRQRNIRKILKSQAKSRQMPQNIHKTERVKKSVSISSWIYVGLNHLFSLVDGAQTAYSIQNNVHWNSVRFTFRCQRKKSIFIFCLFIFFYFAIYFLYLMFDCYLQE